MSEQHPESDLEVVGPQPKALSTLGERLIVIGTWLIALSVVVLAVFVGWQTRAQAAEVELPEPTVTVLATLTPQPQGTTIELPAFPNSMTSLAIDRRITLHTIIPNRPRQDTISYTVGAGDSIFGIAKKFSITPETIWWANDDHLENPDAISPGLDLRIPPVDGVYYRWQEGDTFEAVAARFKVTADDILNFVGNDIDLVNPHVEVGQWIMVPNGKGEFKQWVVPVIPRGKAGVLKNAYGPGTCEGGYEGAYGTGSFVWPTASHTLSGNDYWGGHLGIDIGVGVGDGIFAADSGVIVFAGWANGGYGYMIMVDHGNGYQTLYAHLSGVSVVCGQSVTQGQYIGAGGSTGNSTGPHLHFEVRYNGGWVSPWYVLPAP